jgi:hypothetical protein
MYFFIDISSNRFSFLDIFNENSKHISLCPDHMFYKDNMIHEIQNKIAR